MEIDQLKKKRKAYIQAANIVNFMEKCSYYDMDAKYIDILYIYAKTTSELPLPSGRWGNMIALALEINNYVVAEYLVDLADQLGLDVNNVISDLRDGSAWDLKKEYLFSQLTYEETIIPRRFDQSEEDYQEYVNSIDRNIRANERLGKMLEITKEELLNEKMGRSK